MPPPKVFFIRRENNYKNKTRIHLIDVSEIYFGKFVDDNSNNQS